MEKQSLTLDRTFECTTTPFLLDIAESHMQGATIHGLVACPKAYCRFSPVFSSILYHARIQLSILTRLPYLGIPLAVRSNRDFKKHSS